MTPTQKAYIERSSTDYLWHSSENLHIVDEDGKLRTLRHRMPPQMELATSILRDFAEGRPARHYVLKSRRNGISTEVAGIIHWLAQFRDRYEGVVVTDKQDDADPLFAMHQTFWENLPDFMRPVKEVDRTTQMKFRDNRSAIVVRWAGAAVKRAGANQMSAGIRRGSRISAMHFSEWAGYPNAKDLYDGAMQALSERPWTLFVGESTAMGAGGHFYETYEKIKAGESDLTFHFFPWFQHPGYRGSVLAENGFTECRPSDRELGLSRDLLAAYAEKQERPAARLADDLGYDLDERMLARDYRVTVDQLWWRRHAIRSKATSKQAFDVAYPYCPEVAFASSGSPRFDQRKIMILLPQCQDPVATNVVVEPHDWQWRHHAGRYPERVKYEVTPMGQYMMQRQPKQGHEYLVIGDAATGVAKDASSLSVIDRTAQEFCGYLDDPELDPQGLAWWMIIVGYLYNTATLIPEANAQGASTTYEILGSGYPRVYYRRIYGADGKYGKAAGWYTDERTRDLVINHFATVLRDGPLDVRMAALLRQADTFVIKPPKSQGGKWKSEAKDGCRDDLLMTAMIGAFVHSDLAPVEAPFDTPADPCAIIPAVSYWPVDPGSRRLLQSATYDDMMEELSAFY